LAAGGKSTQRHRILAATEAVTSRVGYDNASVAAIVAEAKVSKPTFYEHFKDRDDCFAVTLEQANARLRERLRDSLAMTTPQSAVAAGTSALTDYAGGNPAAALFLANEPLGAGTRALDVRDAGIDALAALIRTTLDAAEEGAEAPDLCLPIVLGGIQRVLASRLRRNERISGSFAEELNAWLASYSSPVGEHRWHTLSPGGAPQRSPYLPEEPLRPPQPLPPGRPRISEAEVQQNQRLRIMFATARIAAERGYGATTINEIVKRAHLDVRTFYSLFSEKQEALMAAHELGFQELMSVTAFSFFAGASWPERSWEAVRALTQFLEANPTLATVGFVEIYAAGSGAAQRVEDRHLAFTVFLQEGLQYTTGPYIPSRLALDGIVNSIFELVYRQLRRGHPPQLAALLPNIVHLWLAPFLGPIAAGAFIDSMTRP
jgi:AcrR family transcriptional regulator